jgi:TRAP-type C4-dicarboxylate transport system substrate-binding protein
METVKRNTDGRVELQIYPPGQLVPYVQHLEAVRAGVLDIATVAPGYYNNEFALSNIWNFMYTDLGTDPVRSTRMWNDLYDNYMSMDFEKLDLECIGGSGSPIVAYDLFTIDKPIKRYEDMKGLKLRSNSAAMSAMHKSAGAVPVFMGGGAVPDALSKKMLNGVPMSDHWGLAIPIWEYGKPGYWTVTGSYPQGVSCFAASNRRNTKWTKKVSEADKEVIGAAFRQFVIDEAKAVNVAAADFKKGALANGMILSEWPDSEKKRFAEAWKPLIDEAIAFAKKEGAPAKYMMEAMHQWVKDN